MKSGFTHESSKNITQEWYTPPWIFEALGLEFDLDPCAPIEGADWIPAKKRYTIIDNGLVQPWNGLVWLNPPYGNKITRWLARMHQHRNGVALVFSRTDTKWFHRYASKADALLFMEGRICFFDGDNGVAGGHPSVGSILLAWGEESIDALKRVSHLGFLVVNKENA